MRVRRISKAPLKISFAAASEHGEGVRPQSPQQNPRHPGCCGSGWGRLGHLCECEPVRVSPCTSALLCRRSAFHSLPHSFVTICLSLNPQLALFQVGGWAASSRASSPPPASVLRYQVCTAVPRFCVNSELRPSKDPHLPSVMPRSAKSLQNHQGETRM